MPDYSEQPPDAAGLDADFAHRIKQRREFLGWTQEDLAQRLMQAGLPLQRQIVQRIETTGPNRRPVRFGEAITIARVLGISLDEVIYDEDTKTEDQLLEASYAAEKAVQALHDAAHGLYQAQQHYSVTLDRVYPDRGNDDNPRSPERFGPVLAVEQAAIQRATKLLWRKEVPNSGDPAQDRWESCLRIAYATAPQWLVGDDHPPVPWLNDLMRLVIFRDAMRAVEAIETKDEVTLDQLRAKGYPLGSASAGGDDG